MRAGHEGLSDWVCIRHKYGIFIKKELLYHAFLLSSSESSVLFIIAVWRISFQNVFDCHKT